MAALAASVNRLLTQSGGTRPCLADVDGAHRGVLHGGSDDAGRRQPGRWVRGTVGVLQADDGWVRTHGNYPHHRLRLLKALGLPEDGDRAAVTERVARLRARDVEDRAAAADAIAVRVREEAEWSASAPGRALGQESLVEDRLPTQAAAAAARNRTVETELPLTGVRVLDFTRVIAGPVATRALALLGAEVLRLDPPQLPELPSPTCRDRPGEVERAARSRHRRRSGAGQRAAARPRIFSSPGIAQEPSSATVFEHPPGLVHARVSAWGSSGPWAHRRGFDSIVQAASGISMVEGDRGIRERSRPGAGSCQRIPARRRGAGCAERAGRGWSRS